MRTVIPEILSVLANASGALKPNAEMIRVWDGLLARFTDAQLRAAAAAVAQRTHYGAPTVGSIVEQIEGRIETVRVPVTDHWNRVVLHENGDPRTEAKQMRVFPDGRREPLALPAHAEEDWRQGPGAIGDGIDDLIGGGE